MNALAVKSANALILQIASEALDQADAAVKEASDKQAQLDAFAHQGSSQVKKASTDKMLRTAEVLKSAGLPVTALDTHEGALDALEKVAQMHKKSMASLFDDPHGRRLARPGAERNAAQKDGEPDRYSGWSAAINEVKNANQ